MDAPDTTDTADALPKQESAHAPGEAVRRDEPEECLVCGAALVYGADTAVHTCSLCGSEQASRISCPGGHFVCDRCHGGAPLELMRDVLAATTDTDPLAIAERLMALPAVTMHGPEHHALVPAVLVVAARNAGFEVTEKALDEALARGANIPGGWCGYYGACGAAVGTGVAMSVLAGATPTKGEKRTQALTATGAALDRMLDDDPRCCKRATRVALAAAVEVLRDELGIDLPSPNAAQVTPCAHSSRNRQCPGERCPYFS